MDVIEVAKRKLQDHVKEYQSFLITTEKQRSENIKSILKESYNKLLNISFISALELDQLFEEDILVFT